MHSNNDHLVVCSSDSGSGPGRTAVQAGHSYLDDLPVFTTFLLQVYASDALCGPCCPARKIRCICGDGFDLLRQMLPSADQTAERIPWTEDIACTPLG